jgi:Transglycosylase SLT domain
MGNGRRRVTAARAGTLAAIGIACGVGGAFAGEAGPNARALPGVATAAQVNGETVYFTEPRQPPVRLLRGPSSTASMPPVQPQRVEILSFGTGFATRVKVIRGGTLTSALLSGQPQAARTVEKVSFTDPRQPPVTVVRGSGFAALSALFSIDLFGPANAGELDRIAYAVEGVESRHGTDPGMWRPSWTAAQGPMQVTASAALDVGGGNRFDFYQNRLLGRAYLAQMFQRYGNWPDAVAAYNWGPGNMDQWIVGGRSADRLPFDVARYVAHVLRDALIAAARL